MIEFGSRIDRFCRCKLCLFEALINPSRAGERVSTSRKLLVPRPAVRRLAKIYNRMEERVRRLLGKGATISRNEGKGAVIIGGGCYDYRRGATYIRYPSAALLHRLIRGGRPRSLTPPTLDALREHLLEKSDQYLDEMVVFLWDEIEAYVKSPTVSIVD